MDLCNNSCISCPDYTPSTWKSMCKSLREIVQEVNKIPENEDMISLTGGEPTIRSDLFEIIKLIRSLRPFSYIRIMTNGRMLSYEKYVEKLSKIDKLKIEISLFSCYKKIHDEITRVKGSFNQTQKGIENALKYGIDVGVRVIIQRMNYRDLSEISNYLLKFKNLNRITFVFAELMGNAYKNKDKVAITYSEVVPNVRKSIKFLENKISNIKLYNFPLCVLNEDLRKYAEGRWIPEERIGFLKSCIRCEFFSKCNLVSKTYIYNIGTEEFKVIKETDKLNKINLNSPYKFKIDKNCIKCGKCKELCPTNAISLESGEILQEKCIKCYACKNVCPLNNIKLVKNEKS